MIYACGLQSENKLRKFHEGKLLSTVFREQISRDHHAHISLSERYKHLKSRKNRGFTETGWFNNSGEGKNGTCTTIGCLGQDSLDFGILGLGGLT